MPDAGSETRVGCHALLLLCPLLLLLRHGYALRPHLAEASLTSLCWPLHFSSHPLLHFLACVLFLIPCPQHTRSNTRPYLSLLHHFAGEVISNSSRLCRQSHYTHLVILIVVQHCCVQQYLIQPVAV